MSLCKLTICFENPFWIGLVETEDNGVYQVARHVFGPEPTQPEIEEFISKEWKNLRFTSELQVEKRGGQKINPKRLRRIIEKEIAANARRGTKAQQALAEQREANKLEAKSMSSQQKAEEKEKRFRQKQDKRKKKHRGH